MSEPSDQITPANPSNAWRFARLAILLSLVPFVRSCDDAVGLTETLGFPIPYATYVNRTYSFASFDWVLLTGDLALLAALTLLISTFQFARHIAHIRVFIAVVVFAVACYFPMTNIFIFVGLVLLAMPIYELFGYELGLVVIDVLSRLLVVGVIAGAAYSVRNSERRLQAT